MTSKILKQANESLMNLVTNFFISKGYDIQVSIGRQSTFNVSIKNIYDLSFALIENDRLEVNIYFIKPGIFPILLSKQYLDEFDIELVFEGLYREMGKKMKESLHSFTHTISQIECIINESVQLLEEISSTKNLSKKE